MCSQPTQDVRPGHFGVTQAAARAKETGLLLLVLVRPPGIVCPPAEALEQMLRRTPGLKEKVVFVVASGDESDEVSLVRAARLHGAYPPMLAFATPELELLHVQVSGLMPFYDMEARPLEQGPRPMLTGADVLALVETARARKDEIDARLAALAASARSEDRLERAELLLGRGRMDEARDAATGMDMGKLDMKHARRLFDLLLEVGAADEARGMATALVKGRPDERGAAWLELRLLWNFPEGSTAPPRLSALIEQAAAGPCRPLEYSLRALRVRLLSQTPEANPTLLTEDLRRLESLDTSVFKAVPAEGPRVLVTLMAAAMARKDYAEAERLLFLLDHDYPDSPEAARCRHGTLDRIRKHYDGPALMPGLRREPTQPPSHPPPERR